MGPMNNGPRIATREKKRALFSTCDKSITKFVAIHHREANIRNRKKRLALPFGLIKKTNKPKNKIVKNTKIGKKRNKEGIYFYL